MRILVRKITRKTRGGVAVRDEIVEGDSIVAGRGNDCEIHLPDPRVLLRHAEFSLRDGQLYVSASADADLRVDGGLVQSSKINEGNTIRIGPYEIDVSKGDQNCDLTITVELVHPLGNDLADFAARSKIHITRLGLTMRWWVWLMTGAVISGALLVPFIFNLLTDPPPTQMILTSREQHYIPSPTGIWSSGVISAPHRFFGDSCETCHEKPFVQVRDEACLACHGGAENHAVSTMLTLADLGHTTCQSCHKEHQGDKTIVLSNERFCADCHINIKRIYESIDLENASDFGADHPEFRPTVVTDPITKTLARDRHIGGSPPPQEMSGLKFPHNKHLRRTGVMDPVRGNVTLNCEDCHVPTETAETMRQISFERHCSGCHILKFDAFLPDRELMHADAEQVFKQVADIYQAVALRGGYEEPAAPQIVRRRPGTSITEVEKKAVSDWAVEKTQSVLNGRFGRGLCEECHMVRDIVPASGGSLSQSVQPVWTVDPPLVATLWMPKANFTHARHDEVRCVECHAVQESINSTDVLMPGIEVCRACHGGEDSANRVPSTCISCHTFHTKGMEPMRPQQTKIPAREETTAHRSMLETSKQ